MFENLNEIDLNIELFLDDYIEIQNVGKLYCLTNNEIKKIKFSKYNQYLSVLCLEKEHIVQMLEDSFKDKDVSTFEYLISASYHDLQFRQMILDALSTFFKQEIIFSDKLLCFFVGDLINEKYIHQDNYEYIKFILKKQNGIQTIEPEKFANSIAEQMAKKLKEMREKYNKSKNDEQIYDYSDVLSSVSAKHHSINPLNIGQLTIYQTLDQFKRLNKIDKFEIDIQSLLHGAKQEDIKLENWFSKIKLL
jgi:hypothetical protein